jgi:hypothetical protein
MQQAPKEISSLIIRQYTKKFIGAAAVLTLAIGIPMFLLMTDIYVEGYDAVLIETSSSAVNKDQIYTEIAAEEARKEGAKESLQLVGAWDGVYPDIPLSVFENWPHAAASARESKNLNISIVLPWAMAVHKKEPRLFPSFIIGLALNESGWGFTGAYGWNLVGLAGASHTLDTYTATIMQGRYDSGPRTVYIDENADPAWGGNSTTSRRHYFFYTIQDAVDGILSRTFLGESADSRGYAEVLSAGPQSGALAVDQISVFGNSGWVGGSPGSSQSEASAIQGHYNINNLGQYDPGGVNYEAALSYMYGDPLPFTDQ